MQGGGLLFIWELKYGLAKPRKFLKPARFEQGFR